MTDAAQQRVEPLGDVDVARPFPLRDRVAELQAGAAERFVLAETLRAQLLRALGHVERDLTLDIAGESPGAQRIRQTPQPGHECSFSRMPKHATYAVDEFFPALLFGGKLLPALRGNRVEARLPVLFGKAPR